MTALALLKARLAKGADAAADIVFAVKALREATPQEKRVEVLEDLQSKANAVEETYDPAKIQELITAVSTYLNNEMNEELDPSNLNQSTNEIDPSKEDNSMGTSEEEALATRKASAMADNYGKYGAAPAGDVAPPAAPAPAADHAEPDGDEGLGARQAAAEADGFMKYGVAPAAPAADGVKCEACGHVNSGNAAESATEATEAQEDDGDGLGEAKETAMETKEESKTEEVQMESRREAAKPVDTKMTKLAEAERKELLQLRTEKRFREKFQRAVNACKEAGGYVEPKELMPFEESQWPTLVRMAEPPTRSYNTPEIQMPITSQRTAQTARDVFEQALNH